MIPRNCSENERKIAHIVHPVVVDPSSDLLIAQPITFETMRIAREFALGQVSVMHFYTKYADEAPLIPEGFQSTPDLDRSVLDIAAFRHKRKLALIKDILDRLYEATDADYLIYTNVDIALMPHFYVVVDRLIGQGYDAIIVNRRTISAAHQRLEDIPSMYAQAGKPHGGYDCFIFRRDVYPHYHLGNTCIGTGRIGSVLAANLFYNATKFRVFGDLHLTFHIGDDRVWKSIRFDKYLLHNENELKKILEHYGTRLNPPDDSIAERLLQVYEPRLLAKLRRGGRRIVRKIRYRIARLKKLYRVLMLDAGEHL